jgi:hypothetical protein
MAAPTFGTNPAASKTEKVMTMITHLFLYGITFLAGYIFAKIQTLISGL